MLQESLGAMEVTPIRPPHRSCHARLYHSGLHAYPNGADRIYDAIPEGTSTQRPPCQHLKTTTRGSNSHFRR